MNAVKQNVGHGKIKILIVFDHHLSPRKSAHDHTARVATGEEATVMTEERLDLTKVTEVQRGVGIQPLNHITRMNETMGTVTLNVKVLSFRP